MVSVARSGKTGGGVIDPAEHMDVVAEAGQRLQGRRDLVMVAVLAGNPILLDDAVAVEPQDEPGLDRFGSHIAGRRVGRSVPIEQRLEGGQSHSNGSPGRPTPFRNDRRDKALRSGMV